MIFFRFLKNLVYSALWVGSIAAILLVLIFAVSHLASVIGGLPAGLIVATVFVAMFLTVTDD